MIEWIMEVFNNIISWFKLTFSFVDAELLMIIGIIFMSIILLKILFKGLHRFTILKIIIAFLLFGGITFWAVNYINSNKELFSKDTRFYVYGRVSFISASVRKMEVVSVKTNFVEGGKGTLVVNIPLNTKIVSSKSNEDNLSISDIKPGNVVQVYCKESILKDGEDEISAVKIVRSYDK